LRKNSGKHFKTLIVKNERSITMEKTLTQRLNEVNVEAAELLLREMKNQIEREDGPDLYMVNGLADAISKLHVSAEPVDFAATMAQTMASMSARWEPMPTDPAETEGNKLPNMLNAKRLAEPDDYDEKKNSGLIEE